MSPPQIILCVPERHAHSLDSVQRMGDCGHLVWMGLPGQQRLAEVPSSQVYCTDCVPPESLIGRDDVELDPGLDDVERLYGKKARAQIEETLRQLGIGHMIP